MCFVINNVLGSGSKEHVCYIDLISESSSTVLPLLSLLRSHDHYHQTLRKVATNAEVFLCGLWLCRKIRS